MCACEIIQLLLPLLLYTRILLGADAVSPPTTSCSHDFCVHIFIYLFVCFVLFSLFFSCWVLSSRHEASIHPKVVPAQYTQRPRIAYVSLCASVRSQRKFYSIVSSFQSRYNMLMFMFLLYLLPSSSSFRSLVAVIVFSSPPFSLFSSLPPFVLWPHYVK